MAETSSRSGKGLRIWSVLLGLVLLATGLVLCCWRGKTRDAGRQLVFSDCRHRDGAVRHSVCPCQIIGSGPVPAGVCRDVNLGRYRCRAGFLATGFPPDGACGFNDLAFITWPALRKRENKPSLAKVSYAFSAVIAVGMVATLVQMFQPHPTVASTGQELPLIPVDKSKQQQNWDHYGNTAGEAVLLRWTRSPAIT